MKFGQTLRAQESFHHFGNEYLCAIPEEYLVERSARLRHYTTGLLALFGAMFVLLLFFN